MRRQLRGRGSEHECNILCVRVGLGGERVCLGRHGGCWRLNQGVVVHQPVTQARDPCNCVVDIGRRRHVSRSRWVIRWRSSVVAAVVRDVTTIVAAVTAREVSAVIPVVAIRRAVAVVPHRLNSTRRGIIGEDLTLVLLNHRAIRTTLDRQRRRRRRLGVERRAVSLHRSRLSVEERDLQGDLPVFCRRRVGRV